ncbi:MAG: carbohydrate porin [Pseudomonadota bacterium]|nr:carbohydrate porin [Pseudomonadota bacterium]
MTPVLRPSSPLLPAIFAAGLLLVPLAPALAQDVPAVPAPAPTTDPAPERFAVHGQATLTVQGTPGFSAPYSGANSLAPDQVKETFDITGYVGVRLWRGGELWVNPEIDQGFGLSNTLGVAGYPSGEAYKVGKANPYFKLDRVFLRQTIDLGGARAPVGAAANQLAGHQSANRLVLTLGKFSVVDVFDTNAYAHDPRGDFLNWALIDTGSFDYAANSWGYTFGGSAEWYTGPWTLRAGLFDLSKAPNQPPLEIDFSQYQVLGEVEYRHVIASHPGAVRVGAWFSRGRFTRLMDAITLYNAGGAIPADLAPLRHYRDKWGIQFNAEQEVSAALGLFLRAGYGDGKSEADDFTDIDRTVAVGGQLKGSGWGRADDRIGLAGIVNGISKLHRQFFNDGGLGTLVGDGALPHPGDEFIIESYYDWQVIRHVNVTADYQFVQNPAYNRDRGPAHLFALRFHVAV